MYKLQIFPKARNSIKKLPKYKRRKSHDRLRKRQEEICVEQQERALIEQKFLFDDVITQENTKDNNK